MNIDHLKAIHTSLTEELKTALPLLMSKNYEVESMLSENDRGSTYRLSDGDGDHKYLLKLRPASGLEQTEREAGILEYLEKNGIPAPHLISIGTEGNHCYLLRDYIEGETLTDYVENMGILKEEDILGIGIKLAKTIEKIHRLPQSIIHRDIKPGNIVICLDGELMLIDYDTSRFFKDNADSDTIFMGTRQTAAPEQYGFAQSDVRTDIYGLGKTLIFMTTGNYEEASLDSASYSKELKELLHACVQIDPKRRPANAAELYHRLDAIMKNRQKYLKSHDKYESFEHYRKAIRIQRIALASIGCVILLSIAGLMLLKNQGHSKEIDDTPVTGKAVSASEASLTEDLKNAHTLVLMGDVPQSGEEKDRYNMIVCKFMQALDDSDDFFIQTNEPTCEITDLSILKEMPNLERLYLADPKFTDLSVIRELHLKELGLANIKVTDLSSLTSLKKLDRLIIMDCPVKDLSFVSGLDYVEFMSLTDLKVDSLEPLADTDIGYLSLDNIDVKDNSIDRLNQIKSLWRLELWSANQETVEGLGDMKHLTELGIFNSDFSSGLTKMGDMPSLEYLQVDHETKWGNISGLDRFKKLKKIRCYKDVWKEIRKKYPGNDYQWEEGED